ncbi:21870_t:CDS:2 [Gigaspora margarita]|uniref:21870_t:CDS:1 n=1 Tax=Gigaspora margarita TaxID=4874 RepID=A0ABN7VHH8_GIGMA|nr:21870_t:CDS:2 [Gigaspora margarita]
MWLPISEIGIQKKQKMWDHNWSLGGKLFNRIRVENGRYKLPGDISEKYCGISSTRSNKKLEDFSRETETAKGHLAHLCPSMKDQSHNRSSNYKVIEVRHVEFERKDRKGLKYSGKDKRASIRLSSSLNLMSMKYAKEKGLTWKRMNKKISDEGIRNISGIEVNIDGIKVVQEFYVKRELTSDVVLDGKCCCTVRSNNDETMFVISEKPKIYENIIDEDYVMKEYNSRRKSNVADIRHILSMMKDDNRRENKDLPVKSNIEVMNTLRYESNESLDKGGNNPKKLDALCVVGKNEI